MSDDAPWSDMSYKLVAYDQRPVMKLSEGKVSPPGSKQVFRSVSPDGVFAGDVVGTEGEAPERGFSLLVPVMHGGRRLRADPSLDEIRETLAAQLERLGERYKDIRSPERYPVTFSPMLAELTDKVRADIRERNSPGVELSVRPGQKDLTT